MSPEQHRGEKADARSDQFSFCAALYEALYGRLPFSGDSLFELRTSVLSGKLPAAPDKTQIPSHVHSLLLRGLALDPSQRFASMQELLSALDIDPTRDARVDRRSGFLIGFGLLFAILFVTSAARLWIRHIGVTYGVLIMSSALLVASMATLRVLGRQVFRKNKFHASVIYTGLLFSVTMLALRTLAAITAVPFATLMLQEFLIVGLMLCLFGHHYSRYFYLVTPLPYLSILLLLFMKLDSGLATILLQTVYAVIGISTAMIWYLIAVRPAAPLASRPGSERETVSGRTTP